MEAEHDAAARGVEQAREEIAALRRMLAEKDQQLLDLQTDVQIRDSQLKIRDIEIKELAAVIARNLARVKAETADAAMAIARATVPKQRQQVDA